MTHETLQAGEGRTGTEHHPARPHGPSMDLLCTRRVLPLVLAHTVLDVVSFVGYALLHDHLWFLR